MSPPPLRRPRPLPALLLLSALPALYFLLPSSPSPLSLFKSKSPTSTPNPLIPPAFAHLPPTRPAYAHTLYFLGDIHSDASALRTLLRHAGLIDSNDHWRPSTAEEGGGGGQKVLVQTGDCVDRGPHTRDVYALFDALRVQAAAVGDGVVNLLGNHEVMNAMGDWRYVDQADLASFGSEAARKREFSSLGSIGRAWLEHYDLAARIPLFDPKVPSSDLLKSVPPEALVNAHIAASHAGIHPRFVQPDLLPFPTVPNLITKSLLKKFLERAITQNVFYTQEDARKVFSWPANITPAERMLASSTGPLWYRGYSEDPNEAQICAQAKEVMDKIGVRRMIMGHTPQKKGFLSRCNHTVITIDTGMSQAYGGVKSILKVSYELRQVERDGSDQGKAKKKVWVEREQLTAITVGREPEVFVDQWRYLDDLKSES